MEAKDKRLADYLAKIEAHHQFDQERRPPWDRGVRPDVAKDEERAAALGRLDEFTQAAEERLELLTDRDIAAISKISLGAAADYRYEVDKYKMMSADRAYDEAQFQKDRVVRRWHRQEVQRIAEREDQVWGRLGGRRMPPGAEKLVPAGAQGGFGEHARRETNVLDRAREHMARRQAADPSPER